MPNEPIITIIGGGLSAIYAFWGALDAGYQPKDIQVLHNGTSVPAGAIFLYETPIPWPSIKVTSILFGTPDQYAINQWGIICDTSVNKRFQNGKRDEIIEYMVLPDDILITLWGMIPNKADVGILSEEFIEGLKKTKLAVICCFANPTEKQKRQEQGFLTTFPVYDNFKCHNDCAVIYNGLTWVPWVRQTTTPHKIYVEYAQGTDHTDIMRYEYNRGNSGGVIRQSPDILPDCPPLTVEERREGNLLRVGRYAAFKPGYLSHQARDEVKGFLDKL